MHRDTKDVDFNFIPKLSQEESNMLEGKITEAEALAALRQMKNDKIHIQIFLSQFYKVFWNDIATFSVKSVNHGFDQGEMSVTQRKGIITCIPKQGKKKNFNSEESAPHNFVKHTTQNRLFMHC